MSRYGVLVCTLCSALVGFAQPQEIWRWTYGGSDIEKCAQLSKTTRGYLLAGSVSATQSGPSELYAIEIDSAGDMVWAATHQSGTFDAAFAARELPTREFVIAGITRAPDAKYLLRLDSSGVVRDTIPLTMPAAEYRDGSITGSGGLVMSGGTLNHIAVTCTDSIGQLEWSHQYGNEAYLCAWHAVETRDGGWIVPG
ncbi:hypothetical protein HZB60_02265 [candidate division KSB1 bacterium]|nr:hypothetical protein [candidate division KSB1 bacterium]